MPLSLVEVDGHEKRAGVTLLSRYQRYCSVARKRTRFEWANEYGFFRVGGLKCLDTLTVSHQGGQGKTACRETEQNANAAVLWSSYQRGLPEQVCLGGRQVRLESRRVRGTGTRDEREGGKSSDRRATVPCSSCGRRRWSWKTVPASRCSVPCSTAA